MLSDKEIFRKIVLKELERVQNIGTRFSNYSELAQNSYTKTTLKELLDIVETAEYTFEAVNEYMNKMNDFACSNTFSSFMFSVAADTAEMVIDDYLQMSVIKKKK